VLVELENVIKKVKLTSLLLFGILFFHKTAQYSDFLLKVMLEVEFEL